MGWALHPVSDASPKQTPRRMAPVRRARQIEFSVPNEAEASQKNKGFVVTRSRSGGPRETKRWKARADESKHLEKDGLHLQADRAGGPEEQGQPRVEQPDGPPALRCLFRDHTHQKYGIQNGIP